MGTVQHIDQEGRANSNASTPTFERIIHVGLTVRDMRHSAEWYMRVLGFEFMREMGRPHTIPRILITHPESRLLIGLYNHEERSNDAFDPLRTGLDHLALEVAGRETLEKWIAHLDALGVEHSSVHELPNASFITLNDPDGIQLELWHPRS